MHPRQIIKTSLCVSVALCASVVTVVIAVAPVEPTPATTQATTQSSVPSPLSFNDSYRILMRKNIFSKDRTVYEDRPDHTTSTTSTPTAATSRIPIFIGAMREDHGFVGYLEDPSDNSLKTVHPGDTLPDNAGTIAAITLDHLDLTKPDTKAALRILIGQTLTGETPIAAAPPSPATTSTDSSTSSPSTPPSDSTATSPPTPANVNDIIERLKRRRQQQTGG